MSQNPNLDIWFGLSGPMKGWKSAEALIINSFELRYTTEAFLMTTILLFLLVVRTNKCYYIRYVVLHGQKYFIWKENVAYF